MAHSGPNRCSEFGMINQGLEVGQGLPHDGAMGENSANGLEKFCSYEATTESFLHALRPVLVYI